MACEAIVRVTTLLLYCGRLSAPGIEPPFELLVLADDLRCSGTRQRRSRLGCVAQAPGVSSESQPSRPGRLVSRLKKTARPAGERIRIRAQLAADPSYRVDPAR